MGLKDSRCHHVVPSAELAKLSHVKLFSHGNSTDRDENKITFYSGIKGI